MPSGAFIFGSKVSNCDGPPNWNRKMTDLPVVMDLFPPARARAPRSWGRHSPPRPSEPMRRNSRREEPRWSKTESTETSVRRERTGGSEAGRVLCSTLVGVDVWQPRYEIRQVHRQGDCA